MTIMLRVLRQVLDGRKLAITMKNEGNFSRQGQLFRQGIQSYDIAGLTHDYMMYLDERPPLDTVKREIAEFLCVDCNFALGPIPLDEQITRLDVAIKRGQDLFTGRAAATTAKVLPPTNKM